MGLCPIGLEGACWVGTKVKRNFRTAIYTGVGCIGGAGSSLAITNAANLVPSLAIGSAGVGCIAGGYVGYDTSRR